jgi:hypothetical protein
MKTKHVLNFHPSGTVWGLYTEVFDLRVLGRMRIFRATSIQFNQRKQEWEVKDRTRNVLFSNPSRQACLDWELENLIKP